MNESNESKIYTLRDLVEHNKKSRAWILHCIEIGRLPKPDARSGKGGKYLNWYELHTIAPVKKGEIK